MEVYPKASDPYSPLRDPVTSRDRLHQAKIEHAYIGKGSDRFSVRDYDRIITKHATDVV